MHLSFTSGTPVVDMLDHLPPLPLLVDYRDTTARISEKDEVGIDHALRLRDRVRSIILHLSPSILHKFLVLIDQPFFELEHLSLSSTTEGVTSLVLPKTFLAPKLRHLTLRGIRLPKRLRLLTSTPFLAALSLTHTSASGYFRPRLLAARLQSLLQLEELSINFSVPLPRPSAEGELLGKQGTPVTLPNLKHLTFVGVSAYLESLLAQIRTPLLEQLHITLFMQIVFALPHLSHFVNITEKIKSNHIADVIFGHEAVSIIAPRGAQPVNRTIFVCVKCRPLDWQIECATQVCGALIPALLGEKLWLRFHEKTMPAEWRNGEIDARTWHGFLWPLIGIKQLYINHSLSEELSRAFEVDEIGSDPGFLPGLKYIIPQFNGMPATSLFSSFIRAREAANHPISLWWLPEPLSVARVALEAKYPDDRIYLQAVTAPGDGNEKWQVECLDCSEDVRNPYSLMLRRR